MDEARHRAVAVLAQRIVGLARGPGEFAGGGNDRPPQRMVGPVPGNQAHVIGRDSHREHGPALNQGVPLFVGQDQHLLQLGQRADPIPGLPPPVVPFFVGGLGVERLAEQPRPISPEACEAPVDGNTVSALTSYRINFQEQAN